VIFAFTVDNELIIYSLLISTISVTLDNTSVLPQLLVKSHSLQKQFRSGNKYLLFHT